MKEELRPIYDRRKSFYKKAFIIRDDDGTIKLLSYSTIVAYIKDNKLHINGFYSNTTLRHIKEFVEQMGFQNGSKQELEEMYC
jgi:hypothetical protein